MYSGRSCIPDANIYSIAVYLFIFFTRMSQSIPTGDTVFMFFLYIQCAPFYFLNAFWSLCFSKTFFQTTAATKQTHMWQHNSRTRQLRERHWPRPVRGRGTDRQTERERAAECICVPMASWGRVQPSRSAIACSSFNFACWRRPSSLKILSFNHW